MQTNLTRLEETFQKMDEDGFDVNSKLKWGFYFFDPNRENLLKIYEELKDYSYHLNSLEEINNNEWRLHISKVEILTPEKLQKRNMAFNELAKDCKVKLYDGWDVEKG